MTGLRLQLIDEPDFDLDVSELVPEKLAGKSIDAIKRIPLAQGKGRATLGDLFEIDSADGNTVEFHGATKSCGG